jgi:hypothetical protein
MANEAVEEKGEMLALLLLISLNQLCETFFVIRITVCRENIIPFFRRY